VEQDDDKWSKTMTSGANKTPKDAILLLEIFHEDPVWKAKVEFRSREYVFEFKLGRTGNFYQANANPMSLTREGESIRRLTEAASQGEQISLPVCVIVTFFKPRLPSVYDPDWRDRFIENPVRIWVDEAIRVGEGHWRAKLRCGDTPSVYEVKGIGNPPLTGVQCPDILGFRLYLYDLERLLEKMENGDEFDLPFEVRNRWPTPPDPVPRSSKR
jgi:hypothetical protein